MELKDKIALVTGGGQGIGQVIGDNLAKSGAHVISGTSILKMLQNLLKMFSPMGGMLPLL